MKSYFPVGYLGLLSIMWLSPAISSAEDWRQTLVVNFPSGPSRATEQALRDFPDDRQKLEIVADWIDHRPG